ncbi:energy transducer TonB [Jeongeupia chitinilytica]|uniref:TonB C-terminal domain-containing protein n=1 Tax=Jeongeupia chitinilytica TaxID=1041641 RepID=A0ABQ3H4A8_9NEIS|nr:energy transducer TonB [Jeongeupia chitinilytica]GHD66809.1 hypothetical protein GCM10007350_29580 [Jeongeupia chitinilytica]
MQLRHALLLSLAGHVAVLGGGWRGGGIVAPQPIQVLTVRLLAGAAPVPEPAVRPLPSPPGRTPADARRTPVTAAHPVRHTVPQPAPVATRDAPQGRPPADKPVEADAMPSRPVQMAEAVDAARPDGGARAPVATDHGAAGGGETAPSWPGYLANPKPEMPLASRQRGEAGKVVLRVRVDRDGHPQAIDVLRSSGFTRLDEAARKTVAERWRFNPARRGTTPVDADVDVPIVFRLDD